MDLSSKQKNSAPNLTQIPSVFYVIQQYFWLDYFTINSTIAIAKTIAATIAIIVMFILIIIVVLLTIDYHVIIKLIAIAAIFITIESSLMIVGIDLC